MNNYSFYNCSFFLAYLEKTYKEISSLCYRLCK